MDGGFIPQKTNSLKNKGSIASHTAKALKSRQLYGRIDIGPKAMSQNAGSARRERA
jgi:hypothetical protein